MNPTAIKLTQPGSSITIAVQNAATCVCWDDPAITDKDWALLWELAQWAGDDDFGQYDYEETEER